MPETKKDKLSQILQKIKSMGNIEGAAIVTKEGLVIASELSGDINGDIFAAMAAAMHGAAETAAEELKKDYPNMILVETNNGKIITMAAGKEVILSCIVNQNAKLGLVLINMQKSVVEVQKETEK